MDSPFIYDKYVTGKNFIGRKQESMILSNLLTAGENVVIYEPPKTGKMSLIENTLFKMRIQGKRFLIAELNLFTVRTVAEFLRLMGDAVLRTVASTPDEFAALTSRLLPGTHFIFDQNVYADTDRILSLSWDVDDDDIEAMLRLPYRVAEENGMSVIVILNEFQNIQLTGEGERVMKIFERLIKELRAQGTEKNCSFIFSGSYVNAMKDIFEHHRYFYHMAEHFEFGKVDEREIADYIIRGFLSSGKVIERDLLLGACKLFDNNLWYINHFISICDSLSKGYIMEPVLIEALSMLIAVHEPRFMAQMNDLTTFQVSLLRAIVDGNARFSSSEVIERYGLNSSANVRRLKDALCKKEIVTFDEKDEPHILDPLFDYWVRKYYFKIKTEQ